MKVVIVHCYSDNNKGDLGIMLGTIQLIRNLVPSVEIHAVSSFEGHDPFFETEHRILKQNVDKLYPAIIGRVFSPTKSTFGLAKKTIFDFPRMLSLYMPKWLPFRSILWGKNGKQIASVISSADLVISKGGSFICSTPGIIGNIKLLRELGILKLALSLNPNVVIWGQSLGPVSSRLASTIVNYCLSKTRTIILRERLCRKLFNNIRFPEESTIIGGDLAFSLELPANPPPEVFRDDLQYIGFTIKRFSDSTTDIAYTTAVVESIEECVNKHNKKVILIPHVTIDDDLKKASEIYDLLTPDTAKRTKLLKGPLSIEELLGIYANIELLVGTRLHSTIFAMTVGTPAINISYHGTKSEGVFAELGLESYVVDQANLNSDTINKLISQVLYSEKYKYKLREAIANIKDTNNKIATKLLESLH